VELTQAHAEFDFLFRDGSDLPSRGPSQLALNLQTVSGVSQVPPSVIALDCEMVPLSTRFLAPDARNPSSLSPRVPLPQVCTTESSMALARVSVVGLTGEVGYPRKKVTKPCPTAPPNTATTATTTSLGAAGAHRSARGPSPRLARGRERVQRRHRRRHWGAARRGGPCPLYPPPLWSPIGVPSRGCDFPVIRIRARGLESPASPTPSTIPSQLSLTSSPLPFSPTLPP
jgi:hypothetical protein